MMLTDREQEELVKLVRRGQAAFDEGRVEDALDAVRQSFEIVLKRNADFVARMGDADLRQLMKALSLILNESDGPLDRRRWH
jgi:hypothetical protein